MSDLKEAALALENITTQHAEADKKVLNLNAAYLANIRARQNRLASVAVPLASLNKYDPEPSSPDIVRLLQDIERLAAMIALDDNLRILKEIDELCAAAEQVAQKSTNAKARSQPSQTIEILRIFQLSVSLLPKDALEDDKDQPLVSLKKMVTRIRQCHAELLRIACDKLTKALETIDWPKPLAKLKPAAECAQITQSMRDRQPLSVSTNRLYSQFEELMAAVCDAMYSAFSIFEAYPFKDTQSCTQATFEPLVRPVVIRFQYHFTGSRLTNRIDKPEWYFSNIISTIREHQFFLTMIVQPLVDKASKNEQLDVCKLFVEMLLEQLLIKVRKDAQTLHSAIRPPHVEGETKQIKTVSKSAEKNAWAHLVRECITFDKQLKTLVHTDLSCLDVFTNDSELFDTWLDIELQLAISSMDRAFDISSAWTLQYQSMDDDELRVTKSAVALMDILESITELYKNFTDPRSRLCFFDEVQVPLLERYRDEIEEGLEDVEAVLDGWVKPAQDQSKNDVGSRYIALCRYLASTLYVIMVLVEWGESVFFLELVNRRHLLQQDHSEESSFDETAFDDSIMSLQRLKSRLEDAIVRSVSAEVSLVRASFLKRTTWIPGSLKKESVLIETSATTDENEICAENAAAVRILNQRIRLIEDNLPTASSGQLNSFGKIKQLLAATKSEI